jgi:hypothetical protein
MKTYQFKKRTAIVNTKRLESLLSDNNNVDLSKDEFLTTLYQATDILGNDIEGVTVDLIILHKNGLEKKYSLDENEENPYNAKGFRLGKLCDTTGVFNKVSYWME